MVGLLTLVAAARLLGADIFGRFVILQSTFATIGLLSGFGVGITAIRYLPTRHQDLPERIGQILGLCQRTVIVFGLVCSAAVYFFSNEIASGLFKSAELTLPLTIASSSVVFLALDGLYKSALIGLERIKAYAFVSIIGQIANLSAVVCGVLAFGLIGAAIGLAISAITQATISRIVFSRASRAAGITIVGRDSFREWRVLRDFALPSLLATAMVAPAHWICQVILAGNDGNFHQIAIFGIALQWFNALLLLPTAAGRVLTPILVESTNLGQHDQAWKVLQIGVGAMAAVALPCALLGLIAAPLIMRTYNPAFIDGAGALRMAIIAASIAAIISPLGNVLIARSKVWLGLLMNLGWACMYVGTAYLLRIYGALGVTVGLACAYVIHSLWLAVWSYRSISRSKEPFARSFSQQ